MPSKPRSHLRCPRNSPKLRKSTSPPRLRQGQSVAAWARHNGVPRSTAYDWASEPDVRRTVEACRRRTLDRAIGRMTNHTLWACDRIAELAKTGEPRHSVQLRALRSIFAEVMAVAKFSNLEHRVAEIEEDLRERTGDQDHVA